MSAWLLIPGRGGKDTSPVMKATTAPAQDPDGTAHLLDISRCQGIAVQMSASSGVAGTFQLEETIDGTNFANFGSAVTVTDKATSKFEASARPFGIIRINPASVTGLDATHSLTLTTVGN